MNSWGARLSPRNTTYWVDDPNDGLSMLNATELNSANNERPVLTSEQLRALRAIAIVAASMSLTTGLIVGWWFVRMKRSFRHHLIMLLIFSDFFKASWQLIYPVVVFVNGAVSSQSRFCQCSGFFMSVGMEASDYAILAIAVHSALYIFRPGMTAIGEGGLYRYRYWVYVGWLVFSILLPALAFVNNAPAYSAQGTFCYLPVRPFWYRIALAWIPRYVILLTIFTIYASIYIYVRVKFRTFRTSVGASTLELDTVDLENRGEPNTRGRLPSLQSHGLIPPSPGIPPYEMRKISISEPPFQPLEKALLMPPTDKTGDPSASSSSNGSSRRGSFPLFYPSLSTATTDLRTSQDWGMQQNTANAELRRKRILVSRQLRLLFIYPLVYALMWVPSLVSHSMQYSQEFVQHPSFPLACFVAFTIPVQCAVDCWLFTIREKPWRYIPEGKGIGARYGFGLHKCAGKSLAPEQEEYDKWRERKHMSFEARMAYERRDAERREAAEAWLASQRDRRASSRSWWDSERQGVGGIREEVDEEEDEEEEHFDEKEDYRGEPVSPTSGPEAERRGPPG